MAILSVNDYMSAGKDELSITKTATRTSVAAVPFSVFDLAGQPGAGTLAGSSTAAGVVPTDATAGCPLINAFAGGAEGMLTKIDYSSSVACTIYLYDLLFKAGAYAFNANTALAGQPSFAGRIPSDDLTSELWIEAVTAFTGTPSFAITYTNELGVAGHATGTISAGAALTIGRMFRMPLQGQDRGVSVVQNVTGSVATVGTFNVLVMRRLARMRVPVAGFADTYELIKCARKRIYADSALVIVVSADSTSTGLPDLAIQVANK